MKNTSDEPGTKLDERAVESLWRQANASGMSRRMFLTLLAGSGAAAVLASCAPKATSTTSPTSTAPITTAPTTTAPPTTTALPRLIDEPTPAQYFLPIAAGNVEMRFELMANRNYNMPNSIFFVRDHTATPIIDVTMWKLTVEGDGVATPMTLTYDDLLKLPSVTVTRYVECAGNGRSFYTSLLNNPAQGGQWHLGGYGIADWTGVRLSEILTRAGIKATAVDVMPVGGDNTQVQRSMPVSKAMMDDTIVAYMMNGDILPIDHGFPARVLVPGWVGVANVKWVTKISVSQTPLYSDKNTTSYVLIGPDYPVPTQPPGAPAALGPVLTDNVMKSACCLPWPATLPSGQQTVVGYAWSPFGKIARVDVSIDAGKTFSQATLSGPNIERAGSRWQFSFNAAPGAMTITPRATDDQGNVQPAVSQQKWNQLGYVFGAMVPHPMTVT